MGKASELATDTSALHFLRTASKDSLVEALDISPLVADRILDQRAANGFTSIDDIKKITLRKKELLAFHDALAHAATNTRPYDDKNTPLSPVNDPDPASTIKQRGSFSEKTLERSQRPCPRRVDCNRHGR
ncbi:hypothetical protein DYB30_001656 [Aphanomyces astaci]|uniref:Helix-hairpin-helix domain-containing protein n=1 Tax=Aphanomyces astaci TaxID=112090 RepID=A0A397D0L9_APHAT|nr:hypothetical protein DYB36_010073 [Aphanomyces astaci]RHY52549.1 hypothetical protein DYB30_001656 [Aphanomyces astaci]RHY53461.1 hypothetical protein DYB34_004006 [Aphanomyces astaci]RHZ03238.1 hypothetical protein DYB31_003526 [Aphanomyces astaci]RHZ12963.1 hypothetical protein DYB26_004918 [Aphanomyces astaci]